jgi:ATP-dependent Clp protease ATP-binding subunit ClpA
LTGWIKRSGPRGVFMFCGPTGVGKTETVLRLSQIVSGGAEALVRVDCNALQGPAHDPGPAINVLLGAPPGYLGYVRGQSGVLARIRDNPECIVLFDEIEKASPGVAKLLLQIMDDGRIDDNEGNTLDFRRAFLVFTTNAGSDYGHRSIGFSQDDDSGQPTPTVDLEAVKSEMRSAGFGEEFLGRISHFMIFQGLKAPAIRQLIGMHLERLRASADVKGYALQWAPDLIEHLTTRWQPRFGVRHLHMILRNRIVEQLAVAEAEGELKGIRTIGLRTLGTAESGSGANLVGLATRDRDGETLYINLA